MEELAQNREALPEKWHIKDKGLMYMHSIIPATKTSTKLGIYHTINPTLFIALLSILFTFILPSKTDWEFLKLVLYIISFVIDYFLIIHVIKLIQLFTPTLFIKSIAKAIQKSLEEFNQISLNNRIKVKYIKGKKCIDLCMLSDNIREQKVFLLAVKEFLSPINEPRYVFCKSFFNKLIYQFSFQVPSVLATNKEIVESLFNNLKILKTSKIIYNSASNRKVIYLCIKNSYTSSNTNEIVEKIIA